MTIPLNRFDALEDTDLLACTDTNGITYKVTGAQFKDIFAEPGPWDEPDAIGNRYHVIVTDPDDINVRGADAIYDMETYEQKPNIDAPGQWMIVGKRVNFAWSTGNWQFGSKTTTSNVTSMDSMFYECRSFNSPLVGNWDVSNVTNFAWMFRDAVLFNQGDPPGEGNDNLHGGSIMNYWDVSKATRMEYMFNVASAFNKTTVRWDVERFKDNRGRPAPPSNFDTEATSWRGSFKPYWGKRPSGAYL